MKKKLLWILLTCLVLGLVAAGLLLGRWFAPPEVPEEPVVEAEAVKLYWNVDRDTFVGGSSAGMSTRQRDADGFYNIRFAVDGEQVTYKAEKARLVERIDSMDVMGLGFDETGVVTQVYDPADITGGEVASMCYVLICGDTTITVSPDEALETDYQTFEINADTGIYNVTGMDPVGFADTAITSDRIRAFQNEEGVLTHVFIVERFGYWPGETVMKYCQHCNTEVEWRVWEEKYALPTDSAHWILDNKVRVAAQHKVEANKELILDLNGYTITGPDSKRVYALTGENAFLAILDSSQEQTGAIIGSGSPDNGSVIYIRYGTFELYGGTIDASGIKTVQYASAVRVNTDCTFNMYGGTIIGGKVVAPGKDDTKITNSGYGGTLYVTGTLNMYDGTITGGSCIESGGNIFVGKAGTLNLYGGEVSNGTATKKGGNIAGTGKINLYECTVSGGTAKTNGGNIFAGNGSVVTLHDGKTVITGGTGKQGGNIYIEKGASVIMKAGTISAGESKAHGGSVAVYGTFDVLSGQISGGIAKEQGGNIFVGKSGVLSMSSGSVQGGEAGTKGGNIAGTGKVKLTGGSVSGGKAKSYGGNIFSGNGTDVTISNAQISGGSAKQGGNLYHEQNTTVRMNGGTIKNGKSTEHGGSLAIYGEFTLNSGTVSGSKADEQGGNIFVGKTGRLTISGGTVQGGTAGTKGGNIAGTGTITVKNGTISGGSAKNGGNLFVSGTVTMEKGCIKEGSAETGGNVTVNGATWLMTGGTIEDGTATLDGGSVYIARNVDSEGKTISAGSFTLQGGQILGGSCVRYGGNIFAGKECTLTLTGGEVLGGVATGAEDNPDTQENEAITSRGGNINVTGTIVIKGGLISGGTANNGGNIGVAGSFEMLGGTVKDGVVKNQNQQDRNIFADQDVEGSTFTMSGGTVVGGVRIKRTESAVLTGNAVIFNDLGYTNLTLDDGVTVSLGDLTEGAKIGVNPKYATYFATEAVKKDADYFVADGGGKVVYEDEKLMIYKLWTKESDNGKLPTKSGYYILGEDMEVSAASTTAKDASIYFDLNGHTITGTENTRIYVVDAGADLTILGNGTIAGNRTSDAVAGMIYIKGEGAEFTLEKATLDASGVTLSGDKGQGGAVYVAAGTTFRMNGGTITGGTATQGGNVYVQAGSTPGTFNLSGGTIEKGVAGTAGNVCALGVFEMTGGTITGGTATGNATGGNVYTVPGNNGCSFTMTGGTIAGLVRVNSTGSVTLGGTAKITGGETNLTLSDKPAKLETSGFSEGAEIYVNPEYVTYYLGESENADFGVIGKSEDNQYIKADNGSQVVVNGGKLYLCKTWTKESDNGKLPTKSGWYILGENMDVSAASTTAKNSEIYFDLNGKTITGTNNARIYVVDAGTDLTILGTGTIAGNRTSDAVAGMIYIKGEGAEFTLEKATLDASGVTLSGDKGQGGAVYVAAGTTFNMNGGTITGGTATQGGNVYVQAGSTPGTFNLFGGMIENGSAATAGNVCALGVFEMTGGTITGGTATGNATGGNVYTVPGNNGCSFTMTGGTIAGLVRVNSTGSVTLGGTAKITGGETNLTLSDKPAKLETSGFSEGAEIRVNLEYDACYLNNTDFGTVGTAGDEQHIKSDDGSTIVVTNGKLSLITDWTSDNSLPTTTGNYRLTADAVTLSKAHAVADNNTVRLDLNGKNISGTNIRIFQFTGTGAALSIYNSQSEGGLIKPARTSAYTSDGGVVYMKTAGNTFNLYGGTLDGSGIELSGKNGGVVYVCAGSTFNMYGGTVTGGTAKDGGNVYVQAATTSVTVPGKLYMLGGTITGGEATGQGGNVYVAAGDSSKAAAQFHLYNGTISDGIGAAAAGNVVALGVFEMTGGKIENGKIGEDASNIAANVLTKPGAGGCTFTMTGGTIAGRVRVNNAGAISLGGTAKITGGTEYPGLTFSKGTMETTGFSEGAEISVAYTAYGSENSFGTVGVAGDEQYIHGDNGSTAGVTEDGKVYLIDPVAPAFVEETLPVEPVSSEEEQESNI